jgi:hypothetical protein
VPFVDIDIVLIGDFVEYNMAFIKLCIQ